ncbi:MAG TPA: 50S ribosomal protein L4 [Candidatus Paceibacterota bacterium]|nr:50S ribosomal protein L4 [Candidatus Paceibacterota bacterium]HVN67017.1 50S ribosomal protein L4 [Candidatus Sulfotelmatobacter sp.]
MAETSIYNWEKKSVGKVTLPEIFHTKWNASLVKQALLAQLANRRLPWAHAKDRSEVSGGGKKPWRQKGTGRARHGSTRSPIWRHGGKAHGPRNERDYTQKLNVKMRRRALACVLSKKLADGDLMVMESLAVKEPKTKLVAKNLETLFGKEKSTKRADVLFVPAVDNKAIFRAAANLPKTKVLGAESLNVYDVLNHKRILIDKEAVGTLEKHYRL